MTDDTNDMQDVFDRDQNDAALNDIGVQTARHFLTLRATTMSEGAALVLTRDFQRSLMGDGIEFGFVEVGE